MAYMVQIKKGIMSQTNKIVDTTGAIYCTQKVDDLASTPTANDEGKDIDDLVYRKNIAGCLTLRTRTDQENAVQA